MGSGYIKSLDGLRGIAILLMMTFHYELNHFGWMGVQLFFVLSGYLITKILWAEKFREESNFIKLKRFWVRRSLRIFPLYYGFLIFLGITFLFFQFPNYYSTYIPYLSTYTFNYTRTFDGWQGNPLFTHLWSLSIEEQFYLFFPFIIFFCKPKFIRYFMVIVVIASPLSRFLLELYFQSKGHAAEVVADAVYWHTLSHLDAFFMGGLITVMSLNKKIKAPQNIFLISFLLVFIAGLFNFFYTNADFYFSDLGYRHGAINNYEYIWHFTLLNLLFASTILLLVSANYKRIFIHKILENNWLVKIGKVSYGMYVFHWALLIYFYDRFFVSTNIYNRLLLFIPYVLFVYILAALSYYLYELPFLKLKDKFFPAKNRSDSIKQQPINN